MAARGNPWATGSPPAGVTDQTQPDLLGSPNYVWDPGTLTWVKMVQPGGGSGGLVTQGTVPWITSEILVLQPGASGSVSSSGDNVIYTPAGGKTARIYYVSVGADTNNASQVVARVRASSLGVGASWYAWPLVPGAVVARNIGAGKFYHAGGVNDTIILNLSVAGTVYWSLEVDEV